MTAIIAVFSVLAVCLALLLAFYVRRRIYTNFIRQYSAGLNRLGRLKGLYKFYSVEDIRLRNVYDNAQFYGDISCEDYLIYHLQYIGGDVAQRMRMASENGRLYEEFKRKAAGISYGVFEKPAGMLRMSTLIKMEKSMVAEQTASGPVTSFVIGVTLCLATMSGRVYERKSEVFTGERICALLSRLNRKRGAYFCDRGIWEAICRVERGKVTNRLRFAVYQRDGCRCRRCGASGRFVRLEIDHIVPVSKGGKSTYDNLQTLCHRCNVEKGNKIWPA